MPLLISVPHAGLTVPPEAKPYCALTRQQIIEDGDQGAVRLDCERPKIRSDWTRLELFAEGAARMPEPIARSLVAA